MKDYEILDAVGGIDPEYINAADGKFAQQGKAKWRGWLVAAACICIVAVASFALAKNMFGGRSDGGKTNSGSGSDQEDGITYMSYAGPVFPISAIEDADGIAAKRNIDFDFSPYKTRTETYVDEGKTVSYVRFDSKVIVTDSYSITNESSESKTLTLLYPFAASLYDAEEVKPVITVNGNEVGSSWYIGAYSGGFQGVEGGGSSGAGGDVHGEDGGDSWNLAPIESWEGYRDLLEGGYQEQAIKNEYPKLNQTVVIYELKNRYGEKSDAAVAPTLSMEFFIDYNKTKILTYGFNGSSYDADTGYCTRSGFIPQPYNLDYGDSAYLIVIGEDIGEYQLGAYVDGGCEVKMENAGCEVVRYEDTLSSILAKLAEKYLQEHSEYLYGDTSETLLSRISHDDFVNLVSETLRSYGLLSDSAKDRYSDGRLEDILSETQYYQRLMYLAFQVTVPAGEEVNITAKMTKNASKNFGGEYMHRNGYDMVTKLGSTLSFTGQSASISNGEFVEILRQNFGFDLQTGVTSVELDLNEPHYYMEVKKAE